MRKRRKNQSIIWTIEKNNLIKIINSSNSYSDMLRQLGLKIHGANMNNLKERITKDNIELGDLESRRKEVIIAGFHKGKIALKEILVENSTYVYTNGLKKKLIKEGILKEKCSSCGIKHFWNGKPLTLQLDHKNGKNDDNRLENLRLLCPNCHSQTETYVGKNRRRKKRNCKKCGRKISIKTISNFCKSCVRLGELNRSTKVKNRPSKEQLAQLILKKSFLQIGKDFGISDNAVRKWCNSYNLPYRKKDIEEQREQLEKLIEKETSNVQ